MALLKLQVTTSNIRKLTRFRELLTPLNLHISGKPVGYRSLEADPEKLLEILWAEATHQAVESGLPTLVDESFFELLGSEPPQLFSIHLDQELSDSERLQALMQRFLGRPLVQRQACFQTQMVLAYPNGRTEVYKGLTEGVMLETPRGSAGFGYDPVFLVLECGKTLAEMSSVERDQFSPWERALRQLLKKHLLDLLDSQANARPQTPAATQKITTASAPFTELSSSTLGQRGAAASKQVVLATSNPGKVRELREALNELGWELKSMLDYSFQLPPEDGLTFEDNALIKAAFACQHSGEIALADDSGLEVDALGGEPGVRSARYGNKSSDTERNVYLLERLREVPPEKRTARFVAVIALAYPDGNVEMYRGETKGRVLEAPRGTWGFGYDPLFLVEEARQTFAEMTITQKQQYSHRGKALAALLEAHKVR